MSNPAETFRQEATDLLESLEENLLELEAEPESREKIDTVFRALHTIKGSGEMFGFSVLAKFVHHLESAFENVRSGERAVSSELVDISLSSRDHISALLDAGMDPAASEELEKSETHTTLLARIETYNGAGADIPVEVTETAVESGNAKQRTYSILFRPEQSALRNGMRPDLVKMELDTLGACESVIVADQVPTLEELDASASYLAWRFTLITDAPRDRLDDIFLFFYDGDIVINELEEETAEEVDQTELTAPDASSVANESARTAKKARPAPPPKVESVRVQANRLNELMDQLGELVIAQARLNRISEKLDDAGLASAAEEIERLVTGIRDATLSIRMLPIGGVFGKFRWVVRDLASELGKTVELVTEGGETELDKNIIDRLSDPLVHIIRNSMDHGIEDAATRAERGKAADATLRMTARQTGGEVHISVIDDGGGLKTDVIRMRALERGLIDPEAEISDGAVNQMIFAAGFSTAETISSVAGRGVGMDAVRNFVEDLRGAVEVKSDPDNGTRVTLKLPLTLAIIDGLLVRVRDGVFVISLASVEECVELSDEDSRADRRRSIINIREEFVPFLNLGEIFQFETESPGNRVVIVNVEGRRVGLVVDDVIGQHQTVIKSLGAYHRHVDGLAGCTILGDGSMALIIDAAALVKSFGTALREAA